MKQIIGQDRYAVIKKIYRRFDPMMPELPERFLVQLQSFVLVCLPGEVAS
jgi:hypothetical protein